MTGVTTWVVDCGDGECRERPSTAFSQCLTTRIEGQNKADVWTNGSATSVKTNGIASSFKTDEGLVIPTDGDDIVMQPETDGYIKLGDIRGEFASAREAIDADALGLANRGPLSFNSTARPSSKDPMGSCWDPSVVKVCSNLGHRQPSQRHRG